MESRQAEGTVVGTVSLEHTIWCCTKKNAEAGTLTRVKHCYFMNSCPRGLLSLQQNKRQPGFAPCKLPLRKIFSVMCFILDRLIKKKKKDLEFAPIQYRGKSIPNNKALKLNILIPDVCLQSWCSIFCMNYTQDFIYDTVSLLSVVKCCTVLSAGQS